MTLDAARELEHVRTVEDLLERAETLPEPARDTTLALVRAMLALYGEGLARITAAALTATGEGTGPEAFAAELAADDLVSHLLLLHGLHPVAESERIGRAVRRLDGRLGKARVELVDVRDGVARLQVRGAGGCGSSTGAVDAAVEEAVRAAAPEIAKVEVAYVSAPAALIPLGSLRQRLDAPPRSLAPAHPAAPARPAVPGPETA